VYPLSQLGDTVNARNALLVAMFLLLTGAPAAAQPKADPPKLGLLVGCTHYENNPRLRTLYGPANDVKIWSETLVAGFKFPDANITALAEWPDDAAKRPTYANIQRAFRKLINDATPGAQVVILLSGHGMQVPLPPGANPLDPKNFEPDGLDEVFLPADAEKADANGQIPNSLKDDEVGKYLDELRERGAHVMIVFDCCHSGTMTRGAEKPGAELREISRVADPLVFGITQEQIAASVLNARKIVEAEEKRTSKKVTEPATVKPVGTLNGGSLVAFYAAQAFQEAPELPLPEDSPLVRENYYGLLSFTLIQALKTRQSELNYRELEQIVGAYYSANRAAKGPSPFAEGDLDRQVLGYNVWPKRSEIVLEKGKKGLSVNAGVLAGVTELSVLAVYPPAGDPRDRKTVLGYVQVQEKTATVASAVVVPCAFNKTPAVKIEDLPNRARCEIVARDYGDARVKLFLSRSPVVTAAYESMAMIGEEGKEVLAMMRLVETETDAEWLLRLVTPKEAEAEFGLKKLTGDHVLLVRGTGRKLTPEEVAAEVKRTEAGQQRRVYGVYPVGDPKKEPMALDNLGGLMARDLPKLFRCQNLWRTATGTAEARGGDNYKVSLQLAKQPSEKAVGPGETLYGGVIPNNTVIDFRVKNGSKQDVWVVAVYLDAEMEITVYDVVPLEAGGKADLTRGVIEKKPGEFGQEGMVLFVIPQTTGSQKPNFKFLEQSALKEGKRGDIPSLPRGGRTPFEELLGASVVGAGSRAPRPVTDTTPAVVSGSWVVVP